MCHAENSDFAIDAGWIVVSIYRRIIEYLYFFLLDISLALYMSHNLFLRIAENENNFKRWIAANNTLCLPIDTEIDY